MENTDNVKLLDLFFRIRNLDNIDRCSNLSKLKFHSVTSHSFHFTFISMVIADIENIRRKKNGERLFDVEKVMRSAILHDNEESMTGDFLYPVHNDNEELGKELEKVRHSVVCGELFQELPDYVKSKYISIWSHAKNNETIEGELIWVVDKFELSMAASVEIMMGNEYFIPIFNTCIKLLKEKSKLEIMSKLAVSLEKRILERKK